jgi:hypothetical protein
MDHFAIVAPNGLATAQFIGLPVLCFAFAALAHWKLPRTTPVSLVKVVCLGAALLQLRGFYFARHSDIQFVDDRMEFKVPSYYDRNVNLRNVDYEDVRIVDLNVTPELQPKYRTDGIGLMDYHLGWHRLSNGQAAWVAVTDPTRVVVIPEYEGPTVLVSVEDPTAFVAHLLSLIDTSEPPQAP